MKIGFSDAPPVDQLERILVQWKRPELPLELKSMVRRYRLDAARMSPLEFASWVKQQVAKAEGEEKLSLKLATVDWLYDFIRANVKRGRLFDLGDVLSQGKADCLGYAKLFTVLGRRFGLDTGVIEVIVDNAGRYVPHTINLVRLSDKEWRFVDLWYGSRSINHRRIAVRVKAGRVWKIRDINRHELSQFESIRALPDRCAEAVTHYIRGNRYLNGQEFDKAIEHYSEAIRLYTSNARFYFNRAVAYENKGEQGKAQRDYARALKGNDNLIRVMAREHEEVTQLIELDAQDVSPKDQQLYLLYKGFVTDKEVPLPQAAAELGISEDKARAVLLEVEARLGLR